MVNSDSLKMFWEVWRNVTSATTSWSLGGGGGGNGGGGAKRGLPSSSSSSSSTSAHKTRYNRLNGPPTKSQSQPANLTSLQNYSSSNESLTECGAGLGGRPLPLVEESRGENNLDDPGTIEHPYQKNDLLPKLETDFTSISGPRKSIRKAEKWPSGSNSACKKGGGTRSGGMKHSLSSFFPFTSCATTSSASSPPPAPAISSTSFTALAQQKSHHPMGSPSISPTTNGNSTVEGAGSWDHVKKEMGPGIYSCENGDEEDVSDLDDEVEHLTCDVCERAFPTLKLLAAHQRKKRHYGCLQCDSIFPSREVLECHREQMCHYDYAIDVYDEEDADFFESDDDEHGLRDEEECDDEERERLL